MLARFARHIRLTRPLALAALLLGVLAAAALAASWIVVIGTTGNDLINAGGRPGNSRLGGLKGKDTIPGALGDNLIVGDGSCPAGDTSDDSYCSIDTIAG